MRKLWVFGLLFVLAGCGGGGGGGGPSPISWWRAEGNTLDSAGTNNGVIYGGVSYGPGHSGQTFVFNGVDGEVAIPDVPSLEITHSLTLDAWIWVAAVPPSQHIGAIVWRGDSATGTPYALSIDSAAAVHFFIGSSPSQYVDLLAPAIALKTWVHVTGTLDDATGAMRLYINGNQVAEATTPLRPFGALDASANPGVAIGNTPGVPPLAYNYPFNGSIDEVRVYSQVVLPGH